MKKSSTTFAPIDPTGPLVPRRVRSSRQDQPPRPLACCSTSARSTQPTTTPWSRPSSPRPGRDDGGPPGAGRLMYVVATAGHVDHGKSTLVRALTGMEPDRSAEERRRGMAIDLGCPWMTLPTPDGGPAGTGG